MARVHGHGGTLIIKDGKDGAVEFQLGDWTITEKRPSLENSYPGKPFNYEYQPWMLWGWVDLMQRYGDLEKGVLDYRDIRPVGEPLSQRQSEDRVHRIGDPVTVPIDISWIQPNDAFVLENLSRKVALQQKTVNCAEEYLEAKGLEYIKSRQLMYESTPSASYSAIKKVFEEKYQTPLRKMYGVSQGIESSFQWYQRLVEPIAVTNFEQQWNNVPHMKNPCAEIPFDKICVTPDREEWMRVFDRHDKAFNVLGTVTGRMSSAVAKFNIAAENATDSLMFLAESFKAMSQVKVDQPVKFSRAFWSFWLKDIEEMAKVPGPDIYMGIIPVWNPGLKDYTHWNRVLLAIKDFVSNGYVTYRGKTSSPTAFNFSEIEPAGLTLTTAEQVKGLFKDYPVLSLGDLVKARDSLRHWLKRVSDGSIWDLYGLHVKSHEDGRLLLDLITSLLGRPVNGAPVPMSVLRSYKDAVIVDIDHKMWTKEWWRANLDTIKQFIAGKSVSFTETVQKDYFVVSFLTRERLSERLPLIEKWARGTGELKTLNGIPLSEPLFDGNGYQLHEGVKQRPWTREDKDVPKDFWVVRKANKNIGYRVTRDPGCDFLIYLENVTQFVSGETLSEECESLTGEYLGCVGFVVSKYDFKS